jgi:soluble lytic murein transglycosylase-like protein
MNASVEKQQASVAKQRDSIRRQAGASVPAPPQSQEFFTVPWPKPVSMAMADCDPLPSTKVDELILKISTQESVKPEILREVMNRESAFKPCAVSVKGAQGLMQLMPATAVELGVKDPFDPEQNISGGAKLLKQLLERYKGDMGLALAAYNAGPGAVDKTGAVPNYAETKAYVGEILRNLTM